MKNYDTLYQSWLDSPALSEAEWRELDAIRGNEKEIESRFYAPLEFGTAGLRGIMGMGLNRMNIHVIRHATQAFAAVICAEGEEAKRRGVVICHDCRINSRLFAEEAAAVMAGNGIFVRIFDEMRPTPELSFAIRKYGAIAGINVTASHNPKEYNGYKVYWEDGAQLPPQHAKAIADNMAVIDIFNGVIRTDFEAACADGRIRIIGAETDEAFLEQVLSQSISRDAVARMADKLKIVYTPFHGTGYKLVPEAIRRLGLPGIVPVPEQMVIDGSFPTVVSPNPENPEGFYLAVELAKQVDSDLIIGTDPDADRVGVMVRSGDDVYTTISGNQMGVLLLDYIIRMRREKGTLPANAAAIKTIVTTEMARAVAEANGVYMEETFTGFKFMAEKIAEYEKTGAHEYIMAYEESYGYMVGDYVRDKDAVTASMMIAEMAAYYYEKGMTLKDAMDSLYERYGWHGERTLNLVMPGVDGLERMKLLMDTLRSAPPAEVGGEPVLRVRDYLTGKVTVAGLGVVGETDMSGSNVLYFELTDGSSFIVRPSGTEPKIKIYILVKGDSKTACDEKIERYSAYANALNK